MNRNLPRYFNAHVMAMVGAIALHSGLAAWAALPSEPVAIPQQQVIQVAMVSASPAQAEPEAAVTPVAVAVPKPDGMKKAQHKPKKNVVAAEPQEKKTPKKANAVPTPPTSGLQAEEATETPAARTEPMFNAAYLQNPAPVYPSAAKRRGIEGKVMLEVKVSPQGTARDVAIALSSGSKFLDDAAREAVLRWHFVPARLGTEAVEANVIVPVDFKLN